MNKSVLALVAFFIVVVWLCFYAIGADKNHPVPVPKAPISGKVAGKKSAFGQGINGPGPAQLWVNPTDARYGCVFDRVHDVTAGLQLALNDGLGPVICPVGVGIISAPLLFPDGAILRGASSRKTILALSPNFSGDAVFRATGRDDNSANSWSQIAIEDIGVDAQAVSSATAFSVLDLCGMRNSRCWGVWFSGSGPGGSGRALRFSDRNPAGTSTKSSFFNSVRSCSFSGAGWAEGFLYNQFAGNCNSNTIEDVDCYCKTGFTLGPNNGSAGMLLRRIYFNGTGGGPRIGGDNPVAGLRFNLVSWDGTWTPNTGTDVLAGAAGFFTDSFYAGPGKLPAVFSAESISVGPMR